MLRQRVLTILTFALVLSVVLSACAPAPTATPVPPTKAPPTAVPATKPAATAVPPTAVPPTAVPPTAVPSKTWKVALVCGLLGDRSFVDSAARGMQWVKERLVNVETKIIENADVGEQKLAAQAMAEAGYDLVITIGFGSGDWTTEIAKLYPKTKFALVDSTLSVPNGTGLVFKENEGSFTVGMAAAMLTKTGKIGFVGGMDVPIIRRFQQGYIDGAKYVNPNIQFVEGWVGGWSDPTKGKELALTQYQEGADIIFACGGKSGEGVIAASKEKGLLSIGVDSYQDYIAPGSVMTSMMKMVDVAVFEAVKSLTTGTLEAGNRTYGLKEGAIGMDQLYNLGDDFVKNGPADLTAKMINQVIPAVKAAVAKILAGEFCVSDFMKSYPCNNPAQPGGLTAASPTRAPAGKFKVALVCGLLGDRSFVDSAARGMQWVKERLVNVETKIIENADVGEQKLAAQAMAEAGYDLVITIGFGSGDWTTEIAKLYPKTKFALVDSTLSVPNGTGLVFKENEGSFTVGMAAAMLTKTGKIGFVGGMDVPIIRRFQQGYIDGAKYVNPNIQFVEGWVGGWSDPTKGKELALTQYQEGADIIFACGGKSGEGVIAASKEKGLLSIGVDSYQDYIAPGSVMTSMMKMVDVAVFEAVKSLTEGTLEAGNRTYGLKEGAIGMDQLYNLGDDFVKNGPADLTAKMTSTVIPAVKAAVAKILAGEFCVSDFMKAYPCDKPAQPGGYKP